MDGPRQPDRERVAEVAAALPWLCPSAAALEKLASEPIPIAELALEPAIVLLALRFVRPSATPETFTFQSIRDSVVAEAAARLLDVPTHYWLDASREQVRSLLARCREQSIVAKRCAERDGNCPPDAAAVVGLLAPLGELAVAAVSQSESVDDFGAIARRLGNRWRLPEWVSATIAHARLPIADAVRLGADPHLSRHLRNLEQEKPSEAEGRLAETPEDPHMVRLLPQYLRSAARARRAANDFRARMAEQEVDRLHGLLAEVRDDFEIAVRDAKLSGLAELAAGAGHEINNPLAIIAGHARRLRKTESDADLTKALDVIVNQTDRISEIVRELMQFARPAAPNRSRMAVLESIDDVIERLAAEAESRNVTIQRIANDAEINVDCDAFHFRKIIKSLVRNAIEASPGGGVVRIRASQAGERIRVEVEDDGPGPRDEAVPHLFDPFFSGRLAGRGRGLGLATAWRLATINGGEIQYHRESDGPTRFVVQFPASKPSWLRIPA